MASTASALDNRAVLVKHASAPLVSIAGGDFCFSLIVTSAVLGLYSLRIWAGIEQLQNLASIRLVNLHVSIRQGF